VTRIPSIIKGILGAILPDPKPELLVFSVVAVGLPLFSNHFFTRFSISPLCFICARTRLKSATLSEPLGNAIALPASPTLGLVLNSKSGLLPIKPLAIVSSIIAALIRPALTSWIISEVLFKDFSLTFLNFLAASS
jgi:hypothetical protein